MARTSATALLVALFALSGQAPEAASATIESSYSVSIRGFPVGRARLQATVGDNRYAIQFSGGVRGLARLFADIETTASAAGRLGGERLRPDRYSHVWVEDDETETVTMGFDDRGLRDVTLDPPRGHPERYVPLSARDKLGALDPLSAFLWPAPDGLAPEICDRTLPLMDGRRRFDIVLSFARRARFVTRDGSYSTEAIVCAFRYRQVAGHRAGRASGDSIIDSEDMEVWLATAAGGIAVPVRVQFHTRAGRIVLQATSVVTE